MGCAAGMAMGCAEGIAMGCAEGIAMGCAEGCEGTAMGCAEGTAIAGSRPVCCLGHHCDNCHAKDQHYAGSLAVKER